MPSIYIPREKSPRTRRIDDALERLCATATRPLTQDEIADACGISQQAVAKIEFLAKRKLTLRLRAIGVVRTGRGLDTRAAMKALG